MSRSTSHRSRRPWRAFWPFLRPERRRFVLLVATSFIGGLAEAFTLVFITNIALSLGGPNGTVLVAFSGISFTLGATTALLLAILAVAIRTSLGVVNGWMAATLSTRASSRLRRAMNRAYLQADWGYQATQSDGHLQDLVGNYTVQVAFGLTTLGNVTVAAASLGMMVMSAFLVNPIAAISLGVGASLLSATQRPIRAATRRRSQRNNQSTTSLNLAVTEAAQLMQEVRTFGVSDRVEDRLDRLIEQARSDSQKFVVLSSVSTYAYQGAALLLVIVALGVVSAVSSSNISALAAVVLILVRSLSYAQQVQSSVQTLQGLVPAADRVNDQLAELSSHRAVDGTQAVARIGSLELKNLSFSYAGGVPALVDISARIGQGEAVGLIGPSGAGKSTLVQILLRLRLPTEGQYLTSGVPVHSIRSDDWYPRVAFVPQDNRLFDGTVADNISFFRHASMEEVEQAARAAHIHQDIASWKDGYSTVVGTRGGSVSGGQRQRLCLARALLTEPDVLVLDEPTSALDLNSEELVQQTLEELKGRVTIIIVAHRLSTLRICDRIMVLEHGRLQAFADAEQLQRDSTFFARALSLTRQNADASLDSEL